MNKNSLFRKIAYIAAIVLLLLPLFALGRPSNGIIGQLRTKYKMGQANLGKLDPTSESMRLATLGLKGIASTVLWLRADYYKEEKYFDRFSATLNQIALLQPHFISVWQHQAHNLSYNVAPEFEDYRQRYEWIKKGVDYLIRGTKYNDRKPILQYDLGHYLGNKLGKADEHVQYRSLYKKDTEFHKYLRDQGLVGIETSALGYDQKPDNWLTGKLWFEQAVALYEAGAAIKKSPHLLMSYGPLWRMYYAEAIESEGILDSSARFAWKQAGAEWADFGTKSLYQFRQKTDLTLLSNKRAIEEIAKLQIEFDEMSVEGKAKAEQLLRKGIPAEMLKLFDSAEFDRSQMDYETYITLKIRLTPSFQQIAAQLPANLQLKAVGLGTKLSFTKDFLREVDSYRGQVNYEYWGLRAKAEQREDMVEARRLMYQADQLINVADVKGALEAYEQAWKQWAHVFSRFPSMLNEEVGDDVIKSLGRYKRLVESEPDETFVLHEFIQYRKAKEDNSMGMDLEKKMEEMSAKAQELLAADERGDVAPGIDTAPATTTPATTTPVPDSVQTTPKADSPAKTPEANPVKSEDPKPLQPKSVELKSEDLQVRPPTLENPDSQE